MKYAKKMKLIEVDDNTVHTRGDNNTYIDDEHYVKPRVLSTLDDIMNEILKTPSISDVDKWQLYSQALQRYLNHVKITYHNSTHSERENNATAPVEDTFRNPCNSSLNFSLPQFDMSGMEPMRDSLDRISQPTVRNFFEKVRESNGQNNLPVSPSSSSTSSDKRGVDPQQYQNFNPTNRRMKKQRFPRRSQPYQTRSRAAATKRRAETTISADISRVRPCKVPLKKLNWESTNAR